MTPLGSATGDLTVDIGPLCAVFCMRLVLLLLFVVTVVFLVFLVHAVVHLLTESTAMAEATFALLTVAAETSRCAFAIFKFALLRRWVFTALLSTACSVWEPLISGRLVGVLLVIDEVPPLRKMCA